jgi:hypothetical protein
MRILRPTRTSRLLLALACWLALLAPAGAASRAATAGPGAATQGLAGTPAGLGQELLRDRVVGPLVAPASKRDDRERPGPAPAGMLAGALLAAGAWTAAARRTDRPARRRAAAAAGARAPPPLPPAPI